MHVPVLVLYYMHFTYISERKLVSLSTISKGFLYWKHLHLHGLRVVSINLHTSVCNIYIQGNL